MNETSPQDGKTKAGEAARRPVTYADVEAAPEHLIAEIIDGDLVTQPRPTPRHNAAAGALGAKLGNPFQSGMGGPGGWVFFIETEVQLGDHLFVPDLSGWKRERLTAYPDTNYIATRPDWVCEILSASTERRDRTVKTRIYGESGIPHLWLIDPRLQILEAFELRDWQWVKLGSWSSSDRVSAPPFDAISFSLADLWPLDPPLGLNEDPTPYYAGDR